MKAKCPTCKTTMMFTDKGVICPLCSQKKNLVVKFRRPGVWEVLESKNVLVTSQFLNEDQVENYQKKGITVDVQF